MRDARRGATVEPGIAHRCVSCKTEPIFYRVEGAGGAFSLVVVTKVACNDSLVHFRWVANDVDGVVRIGNVDLLEAAEVVGSDVFAEGLVCLCRALMLKDDSDGLFGGKVLRAAARSSRKDSR
jgi:hypothetical protein